MITSPSSLRSPSPFQSPGCLGQFQDATIPSAVVARIRRPHHKSLPACRDTLGELHHQTIRGLHFPDRQNFRKPMLPQRSLNRRQPFSDAALSIRSIKDMQPSLRPFAAIPAAQPIHLPSPFPSTSDLTIQSHLRQSRRKPFRSRIPHPPTRQQFLTRPESPMPIHLPLRHAPRKVRPAPVQPVL
jgi:hypothetical protein